MAGFGYGEGVWPGGEGIGKDEAEDAGGMLGSRRSTEKIRSKRASEVQIVRDPDTLRDCLVSTLNQGNILSYPSV